MTLGKFAWVEHLHLFDKRRDLAIPGNQETTLNFCIDHFLSVAEEAISRKGSFHVALSGGSTPKAIYEGLSQPPNRDKIDWKKVHLYWSDERCVPPYHPESNYHMAMEAGFSKLHIPAEQIHRMQAEGDVEEGALAYEHLIEAKVPEKSFDLLMLGMGSDGHTASLFPKTHGLHSEGRLVIANYIPQMETWRMSLTFECINEAHHIALYVLGKPKAIMASRALEGPYIPDELPVQKVGTEKHKALWIMDIEAASLFKNSMM
jgi:6-phosphogluconolactonase